MMLIEQTTVAAAALPLAQFKAHLRLGTGFADAGDQDAYLETLLRAALAAIEARTGKVLISRSFSYVLYGWRRGGSQSLPVAPVRAVTEIRIVDRGGVAVPVAPERYHLLADAHLPVVRGTGGAMPGIPFEGSAEIDFEAGFGPDWAAVPEDLGHAVLLLAAHYYENRLEQTVGGGAMPFGIAALTDRWRRLRLTPGGA
ncbi:head-tail connector protein [Rhodovulum kholense]|nr:hypothetical protein [Rhodovulum kholense]